MAKVINGKGIGPLAVIDVNVHAARLQISQLTPKGTLDTLEEVAQPLPLGADIYRDGNISAANMRLVGEILRDFGGLLREYGVTRQKAVITGVLREAANREILLDRVRQISGVHLDVLEEPEEIRCIFLAVKDAVRGHYGLGHRNAIMCVIGPDVSQILFLENGHLTTNETVRLGTLRLREDLGAPVSAVRLREMIDPFIAAVVSGIARMSAGAKPELFIAVGSAVRALVSIGGRGRRQKVTTISRARFRQLLELISGKTVAQLVTRYSISDAVAQSLESGCNMLEHFFDITAADHLIVPMVSTRDALLQDLVRESTIGTDSFLPEVISSAEHLGDKYSYDLRHARAVAGLALQLFDALASLHGLNLRHRLLLELAGLLHDTGFYVSSRQHHKHSYYLIRNAELPGVSPAEQELVALVSRYHRRATPRPTHLEYMAQSPENRVLVSKLAALLRIADALDRSHTEKVKAIDVVIKENRLLLTARGPHDLTLERLGMENKADLFAELFGLKVVLVAE